MTKDLQIVPNIMFDLQRSSQQRAVIGESNVYRYRDFQARNFSPNLIHDAPPKPPVNQLILIVASALIGPEPSITVALLSEGGRCVLKPGELVAIGTRPGCERAGFGVGRGGWRSDGFPEQTSGSGTA